MNKKVYFWLFVIILLAAAIRLYNPTFRSLWGDEAHSFFSAQSMTFASLIPAFINLIKDSHLPVYFIMLSAWINLFGSGEYALRLLSILIGSLGVIAFFAFSRKIFDDRTSRASMFLLAISPLAIMHSQEIRMYGLLLLLTIVSSLYFWKIVSGFSELRNIVGYVIATILLMLTHVFATLILGGQLVYLCFDYAKNKNPLRFRNLLFLQVLVALIVAPIFVKLLLNSLPSVVGGTSDMAFSVIPSFLKPLLFFFVLSLGETVAPWNFLIVPAAIPTFGFLFIRSFKSYSERRIIFLLIMCLFPILFSAFFLKPTMPKYLIVTLPFYLLLIGYSLAQLEPKILRMSFLSVLIILQASVIFNYFTLREYHNSNQIEPWREVATSIQSQYRQGDIVLSSTHFVVYRLLDYYLNILNNVNAPMFDLEEVKFDLARRKPPRIWLVTNIHDDRAFPPGYIEAIRRKINLKYSLVTDKAYLPYEQTLVAKLPIKRHPAGASRIRVSLYARR
jgi:uncharacterized membrane protein